MRKKDPKKLSSADWFVKALCEEDVEKRIKYYTNAIKLNPKDLESYSNRAVEYALSEKNELAIIDLTHAIELDPEEYIPYLNRGNVFFNMGEYEKALEDYNIVNEKDPNEELILETIGYSYFELKKYEDALKFYDLFIETNNEDKSYAYFIRGRIYYAMKNFTSAIEDFNMAIKLDKTMTNAFHFRALSFTKEENFKRALKDHDKAVELEPNNAGYLYNRGVTLCNLKYFERAIHDYKRSLSLFQNNKEPFNEDMRKMILSNLATAYFDNDGLEEAIKYFTKFIDDDNFQPMIFFQRGWIYYEMEEYKNAIKDYEKGLSIEKDDNEYPRLIELYIFTEQYEDAFSLLYKTIPFIEEEQRAKYDYYEFITRTMLSKNTDIVKKELLNLLNTGVKLYFPMDHFEIWLDSVDIPFSKLESILEITHLVQQNMEIL